MKKIILASIGNRNLLYQGKTFYDIPRELKGTHTFRSMTEEWLDNLSSEQQHIELNILNRLIDKFNGEIELIVLYTTNQINEKKQDQDTLYEGKIMKILIEQTYSIPVVLKEIQCSAVDPNLLILYYRNQLHNYKKAYQEHDFIVCDAGGTPQQKAALKIMAEYLLGEKRHKVFYVTPPPDDQLYEAPQTEYRRVIDNEQVRSLVQAGQYRAALLLRGFDNPVDVLRSSGSPVDKLLLFGYARLNRTDDLIGKIVQSFGNKIKQFPDLLAVSQKQIQFQTSRFVRLLGSKSHFVIVELLYKTRYLIHKKRYNEAILSWAVFYETYLLAYITQQLGYDLLDDYKNEKERLLIDWPIFFPGKKAERDLDVPMQIDLALLNNDADNQTFLAELNLYIARGAVGLPRGLAINTVRNKVAHSGLYVSDKMISSELKYFPTLVEKTAKLMDLPAYDPYTELNKTIIDWIERT